MSPVTEKRQIRIAVPGPFRNLYVHMGKTCTSPVRMTTIRDENVTILFADYLGEVLIFAR